MYQARNSTKHNAMQKFETPELQWVRTYECSFEFSSNSTNSTPDLESDNDLNLIKTTSTSITQSRILNYDCLITCEMNR